MSASDCASPAAIPATSTPAKAEQGWLTPVELTVLGALWGGSFLFMRIAAKDFGAFALVEVRLALGALVLLPFLWRARKHFTKAHRSEERRVGKECRSRGAADE